MAESPNTINAPDLAGLSDKVGEIRLKARMLTMAIVGYIHSPNDIHGTCGGGDQNWANDIEAEAFALVWQIDEVDAALNRRANQ